MATQVSPRLAANENRTSAIRASIDVRHVWTFVLERCGGQTSFMKLNCRRKVSLVEKLASYGGLTTPRFTTSLTSHITRITSHHITYISQLVAGATVGDVGVAFCGRLGDVGASLFVAGATFGDVAMRLFVAGAIYLMMLQCHLWWQARHLVQFG